MTLPTSAPALEREPARSADLSPASPDYFLAPEDLPRVDDLITEDDTPVDNFLSEKQQRLLTETLYSSWPGPGEGRPALAAANVGLFPSVHQPPLVPDVFLSLDVRVAEDWWEKHHRSYFFWEFGKPPEVVIEIVSNLKGEETGRKLTDYARMGVTYYVVFDPLGLLGEEALRVFELRQRHYAEREAAEGALPGVGLGLCLWRGVFEGQEDVWLRWCDQAGDVIPTGAERAEQERQRAEQERQRAEQERQRAEQERQRAEQECQRAEQVEALLEQERRKTERLMARLKELGLTPPSDE